jgi:Lipid A 3-O-deacylase (PagL)
MKKFHFLFLLVVTFSFAQNTNETNAVEVNYFTGNILAHAPDLRHLITGHPEGVMVSFSKKTYGKQEWQSAYNYPDYGAFFLYQDFKNPYLGNNFSVGMHYNFYFFKRNLMFKIAQGLAMTSNPHDNVTNNKNGAFGSKFMANTNFVLEYKKENIINNFGLQAGFFFTHFSNGRIKAPNSGINTINVNLGISYNLEKSQTYFRDTLASKIDYKQPIKYNCILRTGVNESPIVNSGQHPFYHIGFYADKRLNRKSAIQLGAEVFLTNSFKDFIYYQSQAYPKLNLDPNTDYKRVGVFVGHELFINRISLEAQLGYYVYQPYKYDIAVYDRLGMKYYFTKKMFTGISVKTHGFLAEAMEFAIGARL